MKSSHFSRRHLPGWLLFIALSTLPSCDTLEEEIVPTSAAQSIKVAFADLYVLSDGVGVIDVTKGVTSTKPFLVSIAEHPQKGELQTLEIGKFSYTPTDAGSKGIDRVVLNIKTLEGDLSVNDTIDVIVTPDQSELPCDYYGVNDKAVIQNPGDTLTIDVLANDVSCGSRTADPATLKVVYVTPNGTASVDNGRIRFLHDPAMPLTGNILYSVNVDNCDGCTRFAYVEIVGDTATTCAATKLVNDQLTISTQGPVSFHNENTYAAIRVLNNDIFCGVDSTASRVLSIVDSPLFGEARVDEGTDFIKYWLPLNTTVDLIDSIRYQVCLGNQCLQATLTLKVRFNPTCAIYPVSDSLNVSSSVSSSYVLDVLANDELCLLAEHTVINITEAPSAGTVSVENGTIIYTNAAASIDDHFRYTLCTTNGYCSSTSATVRVSR